MALKMILDGLGNEIGKHGSLYDARRAHHVVLAPYADAKELVGALRFTSSLEYATREAISLALIAEQQRAPHPLWQALLVLAYEPMIRRLAARGRKEDEDNEEIEQRAVCAFLEAARRLSLREPPASAALSLKFATERAVYGRADVWKATLEPEYLDEDTTASGSKWFAHAEEIIDFKRVFEAESNAEEIFALLVATIVEGEPLFAYLGRTCSELSTSAKWKAYRRLTKQRDRVLQKLRAQLGEEGVQRPASDWPLYEQETSVA